MYVINIVNNQIMPHLSEAPPNKSWALRVRLWVLMTQLACSGFRVDVFKSTCAAIPASSSFSDFNNHCKER